MRDTVSLHDLALTAHIGNDCWGRPRPQPVRLSVHVYTDLQSAAANDDVTHSIHYGHLTVALLALQAPERIFDNLVDLAEAAAATALPPAFAGVHAVRVVAEAPKLFLQAQGLGVDLVRPRTDANSDKIYIKDITIPVIIGVNPPEREHKQLVLTTIVFHRPLSTFSPPTTIRTLSKHIESTAFLTLEAFVTSVARVSCSMDGMDVVTVHAQKPSAVLFGRSSGVELTRDRAFFDHVL